MNKAIFGTKCLVFIKFFLILSFYWKFENNIICLLPQISQAKLHQFQASGGVLESSGCADFKTVPGFEF